MEKEKRRGRKGDGKEGGEESICGWHGLTGLDGSITARAKWFEEVGTRSRRVPVDKPVYTRRKFHGRLMKRQKSLPRLFKRPCPMFDTGGPLASHLHPPLSAPLPPFKPRIASFPPGSTGQPSSAETLMILPIDCCSVLDGYRGEEKRTDRLLQQFPQTIPRTLVNFHREDLGLWLPRIRVTLVRLLI